MCRQAAIDVQVEIQNCYFTSSFDDLSSHKLPTNFLTAVAAWSPSGNVFNNNLFVCDLTKILLNPKNHNECRQKRCSKTRRAFLVHHSRSEASGGNASAFDNTQDRQCFFVTTKESVVDTDIAQLSFCVRALVPSTQRNRGTQTASPISSNSAKHLAIGSE